MRTNIKLVQDVPQPLTPSILDHQARPLDVTETRAELYLTDFLRVSPPAL